MNKIDEFFAGYEKGANTFDVDLVTSQFTRSFMGADPTGVICGTNDDTFRQAILERKEFFAQIGFRSARILGKQVTPLDERYTMAKVHWHMTFRPEGREQLDFLFHITYFLFDDALGPKVAFYISHESEQQVMREAGLLPTPA